MKRRKYISGAVLALVLTALAFYFFFPVSLPLDDAQYTEITILLADYPERDLLPEEAARLYPILAELRYWRNPFSFIPASSYAADGVTLFITSRRGGSFLLDTYPDGDTLNSRSTYGYFQDHNRYRLVNDDPLIAYLQTIPAPLSQ